MQLPVVIPAETLEGGEVVPEPREMVVLSREASGQSLGNRKGQQNLMVQRIVKYCKDWCW